MQLRQLGNTDINVSPIGLGTVKLGRNQGVKYPESFRIPDDNEATDLLSLASDLGINLIDTAPAYGNSEHRLGHLLKQQREQWVICSKVGEEYDNGQSTFNFTPEHTRFSIERSLKRLNTDFIDIVLVHSDGNDTHIINQLGTLDALRELQQQGLIRAYGISTKTVAGGLLAAEQSDVVMATYNLEFQEEKSVLDHCQRLGKGVFIKKAFSSGHLCNNKSTSIHDNLSFVFRHPGVNSIIVGTINPNHLRQNIEVFNQLEIT